MQDTETKKLRKIDVGVIVTIALAIVGFAFWLGQLRGDVLRVEGGEAFKKQREELMGLATASKRLGEVVFWYRFGPSDRIPDGFAVCDGSSINDTQSPLYGKRLPNLIDRFVMGVPDGRIGEEGGTNHVDLTVSISTKKSTDAFGWVQMTGGGGAIATPHNFSVDASGKVSSGDKQTRHDNRPSYVGLLPLMRIR